MSCVSNFYTANCKANIVYNNPSRNYRYMQRYQTHINNMSQKQFNKTYAKMFPQFAKFPAIQKRIAFALLSNVFAYYVATNQI